MTCPVVELRDVFRVHRTGQGDAAALQGAELDVLPGEVLCLLGPSGAGKSTLLRVVAGIDTPSAGTVVVMGTDIGRKPERVRAAFRHQHLGLLTQSPEGSLPSALTVSEALELPLALRREPGRKRRRRVAELIEVVGLGQHTRARLGELSGGERQRLALCAAVAHRPGLLLADEPTGELDGESARLVRQLIIDLARPSGMTVIVASHDSVMAETADRTVTIAGGRIAEERRGHHSSLVISRDGWLRLPPGQRRQMSIGSRGNSQLEGGRLVLEPAPTESALPPPGPVGLSLSRGDWQPAAVETRALARAYGADQRKRVVLEELTHRFACQGLTVVAGRSGSGKTTLLRLIAGLDQPDRGQVLIDKGSLTGCDREQLAQMRRQRIGYMPQEPTAVEFLSARENIVLAQQLRGIADETAQARAERLLNILGLSERSEQRLYRLSAGEIQRVALGRAMAAARGLLLLDEPTSRLDQASAELVATLIGQAATDGQTVICASHDPRLLEQADELLSLPAQGLTESVAQS
jgi:ABC-type lipoprotein export system ATPase subunit